MAVALKGSNTGRALVFIGFMGAGKSTAAREAAAIAGGSALDSDRLLEERLGHSIADEFERHGEPPFRAKEEQVVCELLERAGPGDVVALGGGSVGSERVQAALGAHLTVLLDVDPETAWRRAGAGSRPLARDRDRFAALLGQRRPVYERLADVFLPSSGESVLRRALPWIDALAASDPGTRLVWARSATAEYPVLLGPGALHAGLWPAEARGARRICVSDENVEPLHIGRLGGIDGSIVIPAGERHKTLATAERIWHALVSQGVTRDDQLMALGGGVVGDVAGFCAATYQRGLPLVQVPSTLVGQVDSAYGGKTGVDLPQAKNYIGAYHHPRAVLVDPALLQTLPAAELAAGYAEVLKTALIAGGELWRRLDADEPIDDATILACARAKLAIVAADERDAGPRQALNLGHTVGHAVETATDYGRYRHGEAVGLGLLAALRLSGLDDLRARVRELLAARGLPTQLQGATADRVVTAVARDKKRTSGAVGFVLLDGPGQPRTGCVVEADELTAVVSELIAGR